MIFVTDAQSALAYVSHEWGVLTGQPLNEAVGWGWLACLHPADREIIRTFLHGAVREHAEFHVRYRVQTPADGHVWVAAGAVPSFGPPDRTFLGYLGSVTEIGSSGPEALAAYGTIGRYVPPPRHTGVPPQSVLELAADHLLMAHGLIEADDAHQILPPLREALTRMGAAIAQAQETGGGRLH